jgi:hypothetical protein
MFFATGDTKKGEEMREQTKRMLSDSVPQAIVLKELLEASRLRSSIDLCECLLDDLRYAESCEATGWPKNE